MTSPRASIYASEPVLAVKDIIDPDIAVKHSAARFVQVPIYLCIPNLVGQHLAHSGYKPYSSLVSPVDQVFSPIALTGSSGMLLSAFGAVGRGLMA